jgi:phosphoglucosamine mutase
MITASHNPPDYNGIKLLNPDGSAFSLAQQRAIEEALKDWLATAPWNEIKEIAIYSGAVAEHIERITKDFPEQLKVKAVVDCGCGAASVITPHLLRKLGCEVVELNCNLSGFPPHGIEPIESNLGDLIKAMKESGADVGIAHDGDADRMMAVDEKGWFISGDKMLVILAQALGAREVVTTIDASMAIDEVGFKVRRTKVGDNYVSEELKNGGDFGGEPSGSWVFPRSSLCPDGVYAAAQVALIASQHKLSQLADAIPSYPLRRGSISGDSVFLANLDSKLMELKPISIDKEDGFKLSFKDGWLLIRPSGTEPLIRLTVEAKTEARAAELFDSAIRVIRRA